MPYDRASRLVVACTAFAVAAGAAGAQQATRPPRNWSIFVATGWMASSGGGTGTLMGERIPALFGLRFRVEESAWWLGIEVDAWGAKATQAGRDSIISRSRSTFGTHTGSAGFNGTTLAFSARRDAWRSRYADGYLIGSFGATMGGGHIVGKCGTNLAGFPSCSEPPIDTRGSGMAVAASAGAGLTVSYSHLLKPIPSWVRWVAGERFMLEGKVNNQTIGDGRFTSGILHLGIGW